ncbi:MAG: DnaJ C-terminal domain-containing protein [Gammaproteobacteria bacterium]
MQTKDYYKILGVDRNATPEVIKHAYRKLARKYHPDLSKEENAEDRFKEIGEAYDILKDLKKRAAFDRQARSRNSAPDRRRPRMHPGRFAFPRRLFRRTFKSDLGVVFAPFFGWCKKFSPLQTAKSWLGRKDHHAKLRIDLIDAYRGANRRITLSTSEKDHRISSRPGERNLDVRIPKGIKAGQHIRLAGQGSCGNRIVGAGDLYLEIEFNPHPLFRVVGADVHLDLPVAPWEAALGARINIPTPEGTARITIPSGSKQGARIRLADRGIPASPSGHFYVILQIVLPPANSEKARKAYRSLARELPFNPRSASGYLE